MNRAKSPEDRLRQSLRDARTLNEGSPIGEALFDQIDRQLAELIAALRAKVRK